MTSSAFGSAFVLVVFGLMVFGSVVEGSVASVVLVVVSLVAVVPSIVGKFCFSSIMLSITEVSVVGFVFGFWF